MTATLNGTPVSAGRVQIPGWGRFWADVDLTEPLDLSVGAVVTLVVGDATLSAAVYSGRAYEGRASYRLVAGQGKWQNEIPEKSYSNDSGVKRSNVLRDAALACGETIADLPTGEYGPHYARDKAPASDVLNLLAPRGWYVDFGGTTRIGTWPETTYAGTDPRTRVMPGVDYIEIATDVVASLVPGARVDDRAPASDVEWILDSKRLTARVWAGLGGQSRRVTALLAIVRSETRRYRYRGVFEFRVVTQSGDRLNLQPVRTATGFGDLANVPIRPGVAGFKGNVQLGELVLVSFVDGDPSRPVVVSHDAPDAPGWMPQTIEAGGPLALGIARETDPITAGPFAGVINPRPGAKVKSV